MKYFIIKYTFKNGSRDEWHQHMARFIAALERDPAVKDRISYRCMKAKNGSDYYHLAAVADDEAAKDLQGKEFFARYTEQTRQVAGGSVEVLPLDIVAQTEFRL